MLKHRLDFFWTLSFADSMPPSSDMTNQAAPYGNYGYPSMQPAYRQGPAASRTDSSPSHDPYSQSGYQQYSQVRPQLEASAGSEVVVNIDRLFRNIFTVGEIRAAALV